MNTVEGDKIFGDSISEFYETHLVPLIFEPYATDLVDRLAGRALGRVLEIAAGTGLVTRVLAARLPDSVSIVATDLNQPMLDRAASLGTAREVEWRPADAMRLPFEDETFDAVLCQFGVMFFPEKRTAFSEARRVLKPGGVYLFNVWDRIEENEFADTITTALLSEFPEDPPRFLPRTPHGYFDPAIIALDLDQAGLKAPPQVATISARSRAASPMEPAIAYCKGTPLRTEIEARDGASLDAATEIAGRAIADRFGRGPVEGKIQAHVVLVDRRS